MSIPAVFSNFKSAGVYRVVYDKSTILGYDTDIMRLVVGYSAQGPFNVPVLVRSISEFKSLFGEPSKSLEKRGIFFHRIALQALLEGPILCLNLKKFAGETVNGATIDTAFNSGEDSPVREVELKVEDIYDTTRFWELSAFKLADIRDTNGRTLDGYISLTTTNTKNTSCSFFIRKASGQKVAQYNVTVNDWYKDSGEEIPEYLQDKLNNKISDFFAEIYLFKGQFTPDQVLTSETLKNYFQAVKKGNEYEIQLRPYVKNAYGEAVDTLDVMFDDSTSGAIGHYIGCLIPFFKDKQGVYQALDIIVNNDIDTHSVMMNLNVDLLEDGLVNIDLSGRTKIGTDSINDIFAGTAQTTLLGNGQAPIIADKIDFAAQYTKVTGKSTDRRIIGNIYASAIDAKNHTVTLKDVSNSDATSEAVEDAQTVVTEKEAAVEDAQTVVTEKEESLNAVNQEAQTKYDAAQEAMRAFNAAQEACNQVIENPDSTKEEKDAAQAVVAEKKEAFEDASALAVEQGAAADDAQDELTAAQAALTAAQDELTAAQAALNKAKLETATEYTLKVDEGDWDGMLQRFSIKSSDNGTYFGGIYCGDYDETKLKVPEEFIVSITNFKKDEETSNIIYKASSNYSLSPITIAANATTSGNVVNVYGSSVSFVPQGEWELGEIDGNVALVSESDNSLATFFAPGDCLLAGDSTTDADTFYDNVYVQEVGNTINADSKLVYYVKLSGNPYAFSNNNDKYYVRIDGALNREIGVMKPVYMEGYTYNNPKPASTSMYDKQKWQEFILSTLTDYKGLRTGLLNRADCDFRYVVDTFESFVSNGCKNVLSYLCREKQSAFAILNFPSIRTFVKCPYTSFTDSKGIFNIEYVVKGFNPKRSHSITFSLPAESEGASFCAFYTPLKFSDGYVDSIIPSAGLVSNLFIEKYRSRQPYYIIAGPNYGAISANGMVGPDYNFSRDELNVIEPYGVNCMVYRPNFGTFINANQTAKQTPKSSLSSINVRELVIYLQDEIEKLLQQYQWEFNNQTVRNKIKDKADVICSRIQSNGGIQDFINIMDESNNTDEIIDNEMAVLSTHIEPGRGMGKMIHELTLYRSGQMRAAISEA